MNAKLTMGPVLFNWKPEIWRDFYYHIADEAPVDTVYVGEIVCSKRAPFFEPLYEDVAERLQSSGKKVVFSSLAEIMTKRERKMTEGLCDLEGFMIEANDAAALYRLRGKSHAVGPFVNVYNEDTLAFLAEKGAVHVTLPPELPAGALAVLGQKAETLNVTLEVQVYGRVPLAISARCYHARAHNRVKDNCQFVCEEDPDGMNLKTLTGDPFLTINGIQTLSHTCLNLMQEMSEMQIMGINAFRLSPHSHDMVEIARLFQTVMNHKLTPEEATEKLKETGLDAPMANGFYHGHEGHRWVDTNKKAA